MLRLGKTISSFLKTITTKGNAIKRTVKLGYNDHGYNEFTVITNKININFWSQMISLLHKASRLQRTNIDGPVEFVITEFHCISSPLHHSQYINTLAYPFPTSPCQKSYSAHLSSLSGVKLRQMHTANKTFYHQIERFLLSSRAGTEPRLKLEA